jgi:hypothetical protein
LGELALCVGAGCTDNAVATMSCATVDCEDTARATAHTLRSVDNDFTVVVAIALVYLTRFDTITHIPRD